MHSILAALILVLPIAIAQAETGSSHKLVAYWGQHHRNKKSLEYYCMNHNYDKIVLSFLQIFFDPRNKERYPQISFASGCEGQVAEGYPSLKRCPTIERGIKQCQQRGIKITLSMGGSLGDYGFKNQTEIRLMAFRVWNLFLNGKLDSHLRPFGDAVLDGIDINISKGTSYGYADFVKELNTYMTVDKTKDYIITTPPACPFPNYLIGPDGVHIKGTALTLQGDKFSDIYVQAYCCSCVPGNDVFWRNFEQWTNFANSVRNANNGRGPKIYIGLPANPQATGESDGAKHFKSIDEIRTMYERAKANPGFGGFMLWNAGFDEWSRLSDGRTYGDHIHDILNGR